MPAITHHGQIRMRWDNAGGARLGELHGVLVREVMIRRLKAQVMAQLPPKRRQVWLGARLVLCLFLSPVAKWLQAAAFPL